MPLQAVSRKLLLVFALQVASISFAVLCGVFVAGKLLEDSLIRRALEDEAALFASRLAEDPDAAPPETVNLRAYVTGRDDTRVPAELSTLTPGVHEVEINSRTRLVIVRPYGEEQIVLQFDRERVFELALYLALVPLALVLLVIYLTSWIAYRLSRRTVDPIVELARRLEAMQPDKPDPSAFDADSFDTPSDEVHDLAEALRRQSARIREVLRRERAFTRDASHELRTPLTVVQMAADVLLEDESDPFRRRNLQRMRNAAREMQNMLEALLILARNESAGLPFRRFVVNEVAETEVERAQYLVTNRPLRLSLQSDEQIALHGVPGALSIMLSHLIRNVCAATGEGEVLVRVGAGFVQVHARASQGATAPMPGHAAGGPSGPGETIVERLSALFRWSISHGEEGSVCATIHFPDHELLKTSNTQHA